MQTNRVLVISPHPDDEAIGCGGAISAHVAAGDRVDVIFLTSGEKGGHGMTEEATIRTREQEATDASRILNTQTTFWREPDMGVAASQENRQRLVAKLKDFQPDVVYVPHMDEEHPDHKAAAELVRTAVSTLESHTRPKNIWMYEVWTPLQTMDHIVDISDFVVQKLAAIRAHRSQCAVLRFDEAVLGLNRYRGEMHSWPGGDYAEVFRAMTF